MMATECTMTVLNQPSVVYAGPLVTGDLGNDVGLLESTTSEVVKHSHSKLEDPAVWSDITKEFTEACSQLELGVLVHDAKYVVQLIITIAAMSCSSCELALIARL
jgi:hypothetical protein